MPGRVLFSQHPTVATAPRCWSSGDQWSLHPRDKHSWNLPPFSPGKGLPSYSLGSSWASLEPHHLNPQIPKVERVGQLSRLSEAWAASNHSMVVSCSHHQDQRLGPPVSAPHWPHGFPFMHLSPRWSSYSHTCPAAHLVGPASIRTCQGECWLIPGPWAEVGAPVQREQHLKAVRVGWRKESKPPIHGRAARGRCTRQRSRVQVQDHQDEGQRLSVVSGVIFGCHNCRNATSI